MSSALTPTTTIGGASSWTGISRGISCVGEQHACMLDQVIVTPEPLFLSHHRQVVASALDAQVQLLRDFVYEVAA